MKKLLILIIIAGLAYYYFGIYKKNPETDTPAKPEVVAEERSKPKIPVQQQAETPAEKKETAQSANKALEGEELEGALAKELGLNKPPASTQKTETTQTTAPTSEKTEEATGTEETVQKDESDAESTPEEFRKEADIMRLRHLKYYAEIVDEYYKKNDKYPFQGQGSVPNYTFITNDENEDISNKGPSYQHRIIPVKDFIAALEKGLGREIDEYYDPQMGTEDRPAYYTYRVGSQSFTFTVYVYEPFSFASEAGSYYQVEVSNSSSKSTVMSLKDLTRNEDFTTEIAKELKNSAYFMELERKYLHYTKN